MPKEQRILRLISYKPCPACINETNLRKKDKCFVCCGTRKVPVMFDRVIKSKEIPIPKQPEEPHFSHKFITFCYGDTLEEITKKYAYYHEKFIRQKFSNEP